MDGGKKSENWRIENKRRKQYKGLEGTGKEEKERKGREGKKVKCRGRKNKK